MKNNKTIAFVPIRKGSKSIPLKNFRLIAGKPLFAWVTDEIIASDRIDQLIISTDFDDIEALYPSHLSSPKVKIFKRSKKSAEDSSSTESAIFDFIDRTDQEFDVFILVQATVPFTTTEDLNKAMDKFEQSGADSLLTLTGQKKFFWDVGKNGDFVTPANYNPNKRPMRQTMDYQYFENGAFYITTKEALIKSKCRISGKITYYDMTDRVMVDIDEPSDWPIVEKLLQERNNSSH